MQILTAAQMAEVDRRTVEQHGTPFGELMENAGAAVARFIVSQFPQAHRIALLCGTGNNGGDGFVAARALMNEGLDVAIVLAGPEDKLKGVAADAFGLLDRRAIHVEVIADDAASLAGIGEELRNVDLIVDAIVGTGFRPPLRGTPAALRNLVNGLQTPVIAVDLPSGWDADTTTPAQEGGMRADAVVTFTAPKLAHVFGQLTSAVAGPVAVAHIGSPDDLLPATDLHWTGSAKSLFESPRPADSNKGMYGHVLVVGGAFGKAGAPAMASLAALRTGAGLVTAAVPRSILNTVALVTPELMTVPLLEDEQGRAALVNADHLPTLTERISVIALGPGLGTGGETPDLVRRIVSSTTLPLVLDADGLNAFAGHADLLNGHGRTLVLTPHPGEMARLLGISTKQVQADRLALARRFATEHGVTLVLKGWRTLVAHPDGSVAVNTTGNPGMAKGGSGDILTGIVAAAVAQHPEQVKDAVNAAVFLHGLAADLAVAHFDEHTLLATDTIAHLSEAFRYRVTDADGFTWLNGVHHTPGSDRD